MLQRVRDFFGTWVLYELWKGLFLTGRHMIIGVFVLLYWWGVR